MKKEDIEKYVMIWLTIGLALFLIFSHIEIRGPVMKVNTAALKLAWIGLAGAWIWKILKGRK